MPAALPYMPLFVSDYFADTMHLSTLEHGAYLLLLFHYWRRGGPLPNDPEKLRRLAGVSRTVWKKISPVLGSFFHDDDGKWIHDRVEAELERARAKCLKAQAAGQQSGASRRQRSLNGRSSQVEPPTNSPHLHLQLHPPLPPRRPPPGVRVSSTPDPLDVEDERKRQREDLEAHLRKLQEDGSASAVSEVPASVLSLRCSTCHAFDCDEQHSEEATV